MTGQLPVKDAPSQDQQNDADEDGVREVTGAADSLSPSHGLVKGGPVELHGVWPHPTPTDSEGCDRLSGQPDLFLVVSLAMADGKPIVSLACLCERVLNEKDGALTIVRIVDQFMVPPLPPEFQDMPAPLIPRLSMTIMLGIRANGHSGKHEIVIQLEGSTSPNPPQVIPIEFPDHPMSAVNLIIQFHVAVVKNFGDKRFEVSFDGEHLTSIPFRVLPQAEAPDSGAVTQLA